jgi:hypothetical protein
VNRVCLLYKYISERVVCVDTTCASVRLCCLLWTIWKALFPTLWRYPYEGTHRVSKHEGGDFVQLLFIYSAFGKSLCTYKSCWKWSPRTSIQAWTRLILFSNTFCRSAFGRSLCTYKVCWKWSPRTSIQAWTRLILFANTFCRSEFGRSLCTYKCCWKWSPRTSIQAWTRLILFANTFCRSVFGRSLCTYKRCGSDVHERRYRPEPNLRTAA